MTRKKHEANGDAGHELPTGAPAAEMAPSTEREGTDADARPNLPVHVVRFGLVRACVWLNHTGQGPRHNVTVSRLYKGADGRWYSTGSFGYRDLLPLAKCLDHAHTWVGEQIADQDVPS